MKILGIIPARYGSSRFPGKALADIKGKPMVVRVYEQAKACIELDRVVVATDHASIKEAVEKAGGIACMTSEHHQSGTDRCFEALQEQAEKYDYVINIQGDEPFINPAQITELASLLDGNTQLATLAKQIIKEEALFNTNVVKVVMNQLNEALYFSREPIPHCRNFKREEWLNQRHYYKHLGIYAYRSDVLEEITSLSVSPLEAAESLEQLRWLDNGFRIKIKETAHESIGIDTPEDLDQALNLFNPL